MIEAKDLVLTVERQVPGELVTNALKIKAFVEERLKDFEPGKYLDIDQAKKDRAVLNAASKELNNKRLELERQFMAPFEEFKKVIRETTGLIDEASRKIDAIVKAAEDEEREIKRKEIEKMYNEIGLDVVPLAKIFDQRWLNKTKKLSEIAAEIADRKIKIQNDLKVINSLQDKEEVLAYYLDTLDIGSAMDLANRLKENREKARAIERPAPEKQLEDVQKRIQIEEPIVEYTLRIRGTKSALIELRACMDRLGITYKKERDLISERTKNSLRALKAQGVKLGRPEGKGRKVEEAAAKKKVVPEALLESYKNRILTAAAIARLLDLDQRTVRAWLKDVKRV